MFADGCRAKEAAARVGGVGDGHGVAPGAYVEVSVANVPLSSADAACRAVVSASKVAPLSPSQPLCFHALCCLVYQKLLVCAAGCLGG